MAHRKKVRLHHRPWVQAPVASLIAGYIRLVWRTSRWTLMADPGVLDLIRQRRPFIGVFWHGRMMMTAPGWHTLLAEVGLAAPVRPCVISSDHADSMLVSQVMRRFGLEHVHGSNKRGGLVILRNARRVLDAGRIAILTPDGPRGPAAQAKAGVAHLAIRTGAPVVPFSFASDRSRTLDTWDDFTLALPFGRGVFAFGAPVEVDPDCDPEAARVEIEGALNRLSETADRAVHDLVPAPTG